MKDQNTPTNTLEELVRVPCTRCCYCDYKPSGECKNPYKECSACAAIRRTAKDGLAQVSQAVNKANEEAEYWRKRAARWKKEVEELDGKLMDIELNRDETPKGDK